VIIVRRAFDYAPAGGVLEGCSSSLALEFTHMNLMKSLDEYERLITPARERFVVSPAIQAMESTSDDVFLELFLLNFCALGSQMTEPVEGWIRRAAERCAAIGLSEVAVALT